LDTAASNVWSAAGREMLDDETSGAGLASVTLFPDCGERMVGELLDTGVSTNSDRECSAIRTPGPRARVQKATDVAIDSACGQVPPLAALPSAHVFIRSSIVVNSIDQSARDGGPARADMGSLCIARWLEDDAQSIRRLDGLPSSGGAPLAAIVPILRPSVGGDEPQFPTRKSSCP
jgi:hypothetical protein